MSLLWSNSGTNKFAKHKLFFYVIENIFIGDNIDGIQSRYSDLGTLLNNEDVQLFQPQLEKISGLYF